MSMSLSFVDAAGNGVHLDATSDCLLRDLQRPLCMAFKKMWPITKAALIVNEKVYDEFSDQPFKEEFDATLPLTVVFSRTDDPYFFDLLSRRKSRKTLEEEMMEEQ